MAERTARRALQAAPVVAVGVDWLTATTPRDWPDAKLLEEGDRLLALAECMGHEPQERAWYGYAIRRAGPVSCGIGDQGALVTVSGGMAATSWSKLARVSKSISRLDVQVTIKPNPPNPYLSHDHLQEVLAWQQHRKSKHNVKWWGQGAQWQTLVIGARTSESMARIYDKGAESGEPEMAGCWRYEVEAHKPLAGRLARVLQVLQDDRAAVGAYVSEYFRRRGMEPKFDATGEVPRAVSGKPRADDERRLAWIFGVVRPVMLGLVDRGRGEEAWATVGLPRVLARQAAELGSMGVAAAEHQLEHDGDAN